MSPVRLLSCWLVLLASNGPSSSFVLSATLKFAGRETPAEGEYIGFPEHVEDKNKLPSDNRTALQMPQLCGENEWYFPGDQPDAYVCDCIPGYLYHGVHEKCYRAYFRGPCAHNELIVLDTNGFSPVCRFDPCAVTGRVSLTARSTKGGLRCVQLEKPCDVDTRRVYGVNETTFAVECLAVSRIYNSPPRKSPAAKDDLVSAPTSYAPPERGGAIPLVPPDSQDACLPGCKRYLEGKCKPVYQR